MAKKKNRPRQRPPRRARPAAPERAALPRPGARLAALWDRPSRAELLVSLALAAVSGAFWFLACADFDIWPLAWVAMVPALLVIERAPTRRRALLYGWFCGLVANVGGFYWIVGLLERFGKLPLVLAVLGLLLLCAYQALVFLLFAWVFRRLRELSRALLGAPLPAALLAPIVMVSFEKLVPFIFPWYLAITQAWVTPVIQIAELTGPLGVTALLLAVSGAIYDLAFERSPRRRLIPAAATAAALALALGFGLVRMSQVDARRAEADKVVVGIVQGNIPFDEKGIDQRELAARQLREHQLKSAELERRGAELILWTETSYPYHLPRPLEEDFPENNPLRIRRGFEAPLVFGAATRDPDDRARPPFNTALMLDRDGRITATFDKIFLLVFGEYIPLADTFEFVKKIMPDTAGHFSRGDRIVSFPFVKGDAEYRLGPMICYEDILPDFGRKLAKERPHLLVNLTNDAWFGDTSEPWQHLALSVFRAVEMRTDLVRAVNTGVSAFIDANGRVYARSYAVDPHKTPVGVDGLLDQAALMEGGQTFYARFGDLFGWLCVALTGFAWLVWPRLRRTRRRS